MQRRLHPLVTSQKMSRGLSVVVFIRRSQPRPSSWLFHAACSCKSTSAPVTPTQSLHRYSSCSLSDTRARPRGRHKVLSPEPVGFPRACFQQQNWSSFISTTDDGNFHHQGLGLDAFQYSRHRDLNLPQL